MLNSNTCKNFAASKQMVNNESTYKCYIAIIETIKLCRNNSNTSVPIK